MMQNAGMTAWGFKKVDHRLHGIINTSLSLATRLAKSLATREIWYLAQISRAFER